MRLAETLPTGNVAKYYLYRASMAAGFTTPIWYYYIEVNVESYALVGAVDAVWWAGLLLFEIPTGIVGDRIGRRNGLLLASGLVTVAQVAMAASSEFVHFAVVMGFWAFASTFRSGTADAWLYDTLKARTNEDEFAAVRGRGNAVMYVVTGATGILGGYIADAWMPAAYLVSACVTALSVPVLLSFPESTPGREGADEGDADDAEQFTVVDALPIVREEFSKPPLRSFVPYLGLFVGVYWGVNFFVQPFSVETLGLSVSSVGWLYGGFTAVAAAVSYRTDAIRSVVGIRRWFLLAPPLLGALFVGVALVPATAIPVFLLMRASRGVTMPLANQYVNDHVESVGRATVLSAAGMVYNVVTIPFELGAGHLADALGIVPTIGLFGGILVVGSAAFLAAGSPLADRRAAPEESAG
ncbi:MFS transporter [Halorussus gelatinilyticus]|uniref:MFS transporter n=1 Tax=Halorussus gelatinilyticus TaxID=2937524 RepID=A0A8U0ILA3_9EURY|nr:MFS transporter [Halorussus gelatinilyticus]UPW01558.1 MFS transporter [Halorussus gelatinilyticus]